MAPDPAVAGISVRLHERATTSSLQEVTIHTPAAGGTSESWSLRISGNVAVAGETVKEIEAYAPGLPLATAEPSTTSSMLGTVDPSQSDLEFSLLVNTLILKPEFEFNLRANLSTGSSEDFVTVSGRRRFLETSYSPQMWPLLVNSFGRTGTTLLMRMLAAHPAIVVYARPPYEVRAAKYWLHLLKTLAAPTDPRKRVGAPMEFQLEALAVGGNPFTTAAFAPWPEVADWAGSVYLEELAAFCQRSIDGWYLTTARAQGQDPAAVVCFAEKHFPDAYPRLLRELYPAAREVFLVRDFRDMVASMRAYNARKGSGDFGRDLAGSDDAWLAYLRQNFLVLRNAWRSRGEPGSLIRYEDLIRDPTASLQSILSSLDLDGSPNTIALMLAAADAPELRGHGTASSPSDSIGRWRRDLPPEVISAVEQAFGDLLDDFGYAGTG